MAMTAREIQTVRKTWKIFQQIDSQLIGEIFYGKLFSDHPSLRRLFPKDMQAQHQKLIDMLSWIITRLKTPEYLAEELAALGKRHVNYGVAKSYYPYVGEALLWTIKQGLGSDWDEEVEEAWASCFKMIAEGMQR